MTTPHRAKVGGLFFRVSVVQIERAWVFIKTAYPAFTPKFPNSAKASFLTLLYVVCVVASAANFTLVAVKLRRISLTTAPAPVRSLRVYVIGAEGFLFKL
jgi:hypothetical protein